MLNGLATSLRHVKMRNGRQHISRVLASLLLFFYLFTGHWSPVTGHCPVAYAQVPHLIRYQGQAVDSNKVPLEGPYTLTFRLYDAATAGTKLWEEAQTNVSLSKGHFSVLLGQGTPLTAMNWSQPCWLSIQVGAQAELSPRQQFTSVPLALRAETAEQLRPINARAHSTASISLAPETWVTLPFNAEHFDTDTIHNPLTNPERLTATTAGLYLIQAHVRFDPNGTGVRALRILQNGATSLVQASLPGSSNGDGNNLVIMTYVSLAANEYVTIQAYQNSNAPLSASSYGNTPVFGMVKIQ